MVLDGDSLRVPGPTRRTGIQWSKLGIGLGIGTAIISRFGHRLPFTTAASTTAATSTTWP